MSRALFISLSMAMLIISAAHAQGNMAPVASADSHLSGIDDLVFTRGGKKIFTACVDGSIGVFNAKTLAEIKMIHPLKAGEEGFETIDVSPDGDLVAAGTGSWEDPWILVIDTKTWQAVMVLKNSNTSLVSVLRFSNDGKYLAIGTMGGVCHIYDTKTWTQAARLQAGCETVDAIAFHPKDSLVVAIGSYDNSIVEIWKTADPKPTASWKAQEQGVIELEWLDDGDRIVSAGYDGYVRVWNPGTQEKLIEIIDTGKVAGPVAINARRNLVAIGLEDQTIEVFDLNTGLRKFSLGPVAYPAWGLGFDPGGKFIAAGSSQGKLQIWKVPKE